MKGLGLSDIERCKSKKKEKNFMGHFNLIEEARVKMVGVII